MKNPLDRIAPKDVPHNPVKPKLLESMMAQKFLPGVHYDVHADLRRDIGVSDSHCHFVEASVRPAGLLWHNFLRGSSWLFLRFAYVFLPDPLNTYVLLY